MTDLEITKACAEAMGRKSYEEARGILRDDWKKYDPLHDDAQAMALVKKFRLQIWTETAYWLVADPDSTERWRAMNTDINRAICEAVAKMQKAKT